MASHSFNDSGSNDSPPNKRSLDEIFEEYIQVNVEDALNPFLIRLLEHVDSLKRLEEQYEDPRNVNVTEDELEQSEKAILSDWQVLLDIHELHSRMTSSLADAKINMIRFWIILDRIEAEQRNEKRKHRQDIDKKLLEIQQSGTNKTLEEKQIMEAEHHSTIEFLERLVEQCDSKLQSLQTIRAKYKKTMENLELFKDTKDNAFQRILLVGQHIERNLTAIDDQRLRNRGEMRAIINEGAGPSGLQQVVNVEDKVVMEKAKPSGK